MGIQIAQIEQAKAGKSRQTRADKSRQVQTRVDKSRQDEKLEQATDAFEFASVSPHLDLPQEMPPQGRQQTQ
jgi:hypothetical protein